jgi:hypothetical protein
MSRLNSFGFAIFTVVALEAIVGCTSLKMPKANVWPFTGDDKPGMPNRVVATWTDTVLYQPNQTPMRGFGGRLLFYDGDKPEPIKVEGTLTVYAFDETKRDLNDAKPDRKYIFTKDQLVTHYSKSKLGHSYSVWIPWDEVGGEQKDISMIVRFTPEKGSVVVSEQTKHLLPGKTQIVAKNPDQGISPFNSLLGAAGQPQTSSGSTVNPVSYVTPLPPVNGGNQGRLQNGMDQPRHMKSETITVPAQSSLYNPSAMSDVVNPATPNPELSPPVNGTSLATLTGEINTKVGGIDAVQPARYQENTIASTANVTSIRDARGIVQPNRFAPERPLVPSGPSTLLNRDHGQWQPPLTGQSYFPAASRQSLSSQQPSNSQPQTVNGGLPSVVNAGIAQN